MAGAPVGNQNAAKGNRWATAIESALRERSRGKQVEALQELAGVLLDKAAEGDLTALKELGDRLDGKPKQAMDVEATGNITVNLLSYGVATSANEPPT